ncbi:uncharacterized protein METZ01_LOCUS514109, partial [marine metagenome]
VQTSVQHTTPTQLHGLLPNAAHRLCPRKLCTPAHHAKVSLQDSHVQIR